MENLAVLENCELFVSHSVPAGSVGFLSLSYSSTSDLQLPKSSDRSKPVSIDSDLETLTYIDYFEETGFVFNLTKKAYN